MPFFPNFTYKIKGIFSIYTFYRMNTELEERKVRSRIGTQPCHPLLFLL